MAIRAAEAAVRSPRQGEVEMTERLGRVMLRARLVEEKLGSLYRAGRIVGGVYLLSDPPLPLPPNSLGQLPAQAELFWPPRKQS